MLSAVVTSGWPSYGKFFFLATFLNFSTMTLYCSYNQKNKLALTVGIWKGSYDFFSLVVNVFLDRGPLEDLMNDMELLEKYTSFYRHNFSRILDFRLRSFEQHNSHI